MEDWFAIKRIKDNNPNFSNRKLGRLLNISHNTVKKVLNSEKGPSYERKEYINPELLKFKDIIEEGIIGNGLCKSRILEDLLSKGYKGSKSAFYRYASKFKIQEERAFKPYETLAGEQAQFDWSPYDIEINGIKTRVYVYSYILGFSRYRVLECSLSQTQASVFEAIESSFIELGGVTERIQTDNASCFINTKSRGDYEWNKHYLQFCDHYKINPTRSNVRSPWSKGKVERQFAYLEQHFIKGNVFESFENFRKRLKDFQNEVNNKVHHTTNKTPKSLFEEEKISLKKLPELRYVHIKDELRKVSADCLISFNSNRYSVPHIFVGQEVWLRISQGNKLLIYSNKNILIAEHDISLQKKQVIINQEHYKNYRSEKGNWQRVSEDFLAIFPNDEWFLEKLKQQKKINSAYNLTRIIEYSKHYSISDLSNSFVYCNVFNTFNHKIIYRYLQVKCNEIAILPLPINPNVLNAIESQDIKRPLSVYKIDI